jgi:hypothetical protein
MRDFKKANTGVITPDTDAAAPEMVEYRVRMNFEGLDKKRVKLLQERQLWSDDFPQSQIDLALRSSGIKNFRFAEHPALDEAVVYVHRELTQAELQKIIDFKLDIVSGPRTVISDPDTSPDRWLGSSVKPYEREQSIVSVHLNGHEVMMAGSLQEKNAGMPFNELAQRTRIPADILERVLHDMTELAQGVARIGGQTDIRKDTFVSHAGCTESPHWPARPLPTEP